MSRPELTTTTDISYASGSGPRWRVSITVECENPRVFISDYFYFFSRWGAKFGAWRRAIAFRREAKREIMGKNRNIVKTQVSYIKHRRNTDEYSRR